MKLICQWYDPNEQVRRDELEAVRTGNLASGVFDECVYLDGSVGWSYGALIDYCASHFLGELCVIANTDIRFGNTTPLLVGCCKPNRIIALTRYESEASPRMVGYAVSESFFSGTQDAWGFVAGGIPSIGEQLMLGTIGCENALLGEAVESGVEVFNPALDIRTYHVHSQPPTDYRPTASGRLYAYPELSTLSSSGLCLVRDAAVGVQNLRVVGTVRK